MKQEKEFGKDFEQVEFETTEKKNKKWIKTLIITILLMISATGICVYINKDSIFKEETGKVAIYKNIEFKEDLKLEAGKEINVNDYIKRVIGGELIVDEEAINKIDTKKVGETIIILSVKDANGDIQEFECKLNIVDTVKPEIKGAEKEIKITAGDKVNLLKGVTAEDEIDGKLDVKVTGKYDVNKAGEYKLKYVAEDKSDNKEEKEFTLVVNKKEEKKTNVTTNKNTVTTDKNTTTTNNNTTTTKKETSTKKNSTTSKNNTTTNKNITTSKNNTTTNKSNTNKKPSNLSGSYQGASGLLSLVNSTRKSAGVGNVSWSSILESAAKTRAKELATSYSHTRPNGGAFYTVNSNVYAENIANGYGSVNSVHDAWVNSPGHYKNITNKSYKTMGAACYSVNGQIYWVELFGY